MIAFCSFTGTWVQPIWIRCYHGSPFCSGCQFGYDAATGVLGTVALGTMLGTMRHRSPFVLGYGQFGYDVAKGAPFVLGTAARGTLLPREKRGTMMLMPRGKRVQ
jgi:hypothetical protein